MRVLVVDDEKLLVKGIKFNLENDGYEVLTGSDGQEALEIASSQQVDLIILDVMMPRMDGFEVLRCLRAEKNHTPVLLLTARSEIEDRVMGLDAGADDYLVKPFDIRELLARIRVLTRTRQQETTDICFGNVRLDTVEFTLSGPNGATQLANKEYQCMRLLLQNPGKVIAPEQFMSNIWEPDSLGQENALWTVIYNLRKKLTNIGADVRIGNKRNLGYMVERL